MDRDTIETTGLPRMQPLADGRAAPAVPRDLAGTGVSRGTLLDLALKAAHVVPRFTTEWAAQQLLVPQVLVADLLEQLRQEHLIEVLGEAGLLGYRYTISERGRERAARLLEISGYVGAAPVSLPAYVALLEWQLARMPPVSLAKVRERLAGLVLPDDIVEVAGMAATSGRSLFLFGTPGNGKTSVGRLLHHALEGNLWIPRCVAVETNIIRIFDPQVHEAVALPADLSRVIDQRWVLIRRPFIVVGGEATLESFDLIWTPSLRYYEAPLHVKANGGTFLIDDFGRQRVDPFDLLNRWIIPLEHGYDFMTLHTGQKIQVPFRQLLIVATNLDPMRVTDPAFLRRMGYRVHLNGPNPEQYAEIFRREAARHGTTVPPDLIPWLLERYRTEGRELRGCEPGDLIERAGDLCRAREQPLRLDQEVLSRAWAGYFGTG